MRPSRPEVSGPLTPFAGNPQPCLLRLRCTRERLGEVLGFLAIPAKAGQVGELFAGLREVAGLDIPLAEVFVRAEMGRIVGQGLVVEGFRSRVILELAMAEAEPVRHVGRGLELGLELHEERYRLPVGAGLDQRTGAFVGRVAVEVREIGTHCSGGCTSETEHECGEGGAAEHWGVPDDCAASLSGSSEPASARRCYLLRNGSKE